MVDNNIVTNLILDAQNVSETAFNELYQVTHGILFNQVFEILNDVDLSNDIIHDTYLKVLQNKMKSDGNGLSYLITIARNLAINSYNKRKREVFIPFDEFVTVDETKVSDNFILEVMNKCLSPYQIELINMHVIEGFKHSEIATKLNKPVGTIMWQYNEAIKAIRKYLKG